MRITFRKKSLLTCLLFTVFGCIPATLANEHFDFLLELPTATNVQEKVEKTRYLLPPLSTNGKEVPGGWLHVDDSGVLRDLSCPYFADRRIDLPTFRKYVDAILTEYRKQGRILEPPRWDPNGEHALQFCDRSKRYCPPYAYTDCVVVSGQRFRTSQVVAVNLKEGGRYGKSVTFYDTIRPRPKAMLEIESPVALVSTNDSIKMATKWLEEDMVAVPLHLTIDVEGNPHKPTFFRCFGVLVPPGYDLRNGALFFCHPNLRGKKGYQLAHAVHFHAADSNYQEYLVPADASLAVDVKREPYDLKDE